MLMPLLKLVMLTYELDKAFVSVFLVTSRPVGLNIIGFKTLLCQLILTKRQAWDNAII